MQFYPRAGLVLLFGAAIATSANLPDWLAMLESGNRLGAVFFREMALPAGAVTARRPPKETRPELTQWIQQAPANAELYALRAREAESQLELAAAEEDWKKYAELAADKAAGAIALADFYHRQARVTDELKALARAASQPSPPSERFTPVKEQRAWNLFERMLHLAKRQLLPQEVFADIYRQWRARYPNEREPFTYAISHAIAQKQPQQALALAQQYAKQFPEDWAESIRLSAEVERAGSGLAGAIAFYDRQFRPLWPEKLVASYFDLMRVARQTRRFLARARASSAANPLALDPVARLFHYHHQEGNPGAAHRVLSDYVQRKEQVAGSWTPEELEAVAQLFDRLEATSSAARCWYALYSHPKATAAQQETALATLTGYLLWTPERGTALESSNLLLYQDLATADSGPGYLNGILSLLLNSTEPQWKFQAQQAAAEAYFRRARGAQLLELFERRFPQSPRRAALRFQMIQAYFNHGANDAVIQAASQFLASFPNHQARIQVSTLLADSYARKGQFREELAVYDTLLEELAKRAQGVPLGEGVVARSSGEAATAGPRSLEYARLLDRYVARLAALKRPKDALVVLRRELDRNPDDPGLYERLALFLDQNKLAAEIEAVYRRASQRFADRSWHHKLARFYLRQRQIAAFRTLSSEVTRIFSGHELERYVSEVVASAPGLDSQIQRQVNLAAHQRFPRNVRFVKNLLNIYERRETANPVEWERLLRSYWFYDDELRARFFQFLQRTGKLAAEIQALRASNLVDNPAARRMLAEAEIWRCHYEDAFAPLSALAKETPGEEALNERAASLARSLSAHDPRRRIDAVGFETSISKQAPANRQVWTRLGELYAEAERFSLARPYWQRLATLEPGDPEGYLAAATLFWDYFQYDDALSMIESGRRRLSNPALHAYEAGAIYENKRDYERAIQEYVRGALAQPGGSPAQTRLVELARRPKLQGAMESATLRPLNFEAPDLAALSLRIALLEAQQRKQDLEALLIHLADRAENQELLARLEEEARRLGLPGAEERALLRQIALSDDPLERIRQQLALARHYENHGQLTASGKIIDALVRDHPRSLGVVRAAVNYHWRTKNAGRALELLNAAAAIAHPDRRPDLQFEAAQKATESGNYELARQQLQQLLRSKPEHLPYIQAMANTFALQGDDRALRSFYQEQIATFSKLQGSQLSQLRRSLIPVLTRMKDYAAAVDQYIEILNRYPEDTALADEAAAFAVLYGQQARLTNFYQKTVTASPKDARFHALLAKLLIRFEDYGGAIAALTRASQLRPDRIDLLILRGDLEERLLRWDEAAATFAQVYELSYRQSAWMERVAQIRARQRKVEECLAALRTAYLEGRQESPAGYFQAAEKLEAWGLFAPARELAEKGLELAGSKLVDEHNYAIPIYARVMTRFGEFDAAYGKAPYEQLVSALAREVGRLANSEQKARFAAFLDKLPVRGSASLGQLAGIPDWEVKRLVEVLMSQPGSEPASEALERLRQLQTQRLAFGELGRQLEEYGELLPPSEFRQQLLLWAAEAYRAAGDTAAEVRVLERSEPRPKRYLDLVAKSNPSRLLELSRTGPRDAAVQAALESGNASLALQALSARAAGLPPVWLRAYTALTGLYFRMRTPVIQQAFQQALGSMLIQDRIGKPVNRSQQLVGNLWYFYASRYAEYLDLFKSSEAEDFLPASVEASPASPEAYYELAEYEQESGRAGRALADYELALQLQPQHAAALVRRGRLLAAQNNLAAAQASFREALEALATQLEQRQPPYRAVSDLRMAIDELAARNLLTPLRREVDRAVLAALRRFGSSPLREVLKQFDVSWLLTASRSLASPGEFLQALAQEPWLENKARAQLLEQALKDYEREAASAVGEARDNLLFRYYTLYGEYLELLVISDPDRAARARAFFPEQGRQRLADVLLGVDLYLASRSGRLSQVIASWRQGELTPPEDNALREAAIKLRDWGATAASRQLLKFQYEQRLRLGSTAASEFLGLAELLLEEGEVAAAVSQLRRMNLLTQPAFEHLPAAAALLRKYQRPEAREFEDQAAQALPWLAAPPVRAKATTLAAAVAQVRAFPDDTQAKLTLFPLARAAGEHRLAINALAQIVEPELRHVFDADFSLEYEIQPFLARRFLDHTPLGRAERAELARAASDSLFRLELLANAVALRQVAAALEPAPTDRSWLQEQRRELERRKVNRERQPQISEQLAQPRLVRPRVLPAGRAQ